MTERTCHICEAPAGRNTLPDSCDACYHLEVEAVTAMVPDEELGRRYTRRVKHFGIGRPAEVRDHRRHAINQQLA